MTDLSEGLEMLADREGPPSAVSAAEAVRQGRVRIRRRRSAMAGAVAAIVVTAGALASLGLGGGVTTVQPAGPTGTTVAPGPSRPGPTAPPTVRPSMVQTTAPVTGPDPLVPGARFGWLPDGINAIAYSVDFRGATVTATTPGVAPRFTLRVYPQGAVPESDDFPTGAHAVRIDAPPVNGREAYWVSSNDPGYAAALDRLRWQIADGRWAELDAQYLAAGDRQQVPLRVAAGVTFSTQPVPLPFRLTNLPAGYRISRVSLSQPTDAKKPTWFVQFEVSAPGGGVADALITPDPSLINRGAMCTSNQGVQVCTMMTNAGPDVVGTVGGKSGWLDRFTLLGADPSKWTTDVIG